MAKLEQVQALTFDLFGTILDLGGSLTPFIADMLRERKEPTPQQNSSGSNGVIASGWSNFRTQS